MLSATLGWPLFRGWFMRKFFSAFILAGALFCSHAGAASFGPRENTLIFDGRQSSTSYRIDNSDTRLPWLVQAWVEDINEKRTDDFTSVPLVFRVEPSSTFTVRIVKKVRSRKTGKHYTGRSLTPCRGERSEQKLTATKSVHSSVWHTGLRFP